MLSSVFSCLHHGLQGHLVEVQVDVSAGIPGFTIVGLADASVREARERVRAAIKNAGLPFPPRRLTVNLAPAELRKEGSGLDLAIAVAIVAASTEIRVPARAAYLGELSLDGRVRHVAGVLVAAGSLRADGVTELYVAEEDAAEAALIPGLEIHPVATLQGLVAHFAEGAPLPAADHVPNRLVSPTPASADDLAELQGQDAARRALEVAAAGGHHLLLSGPPGAGKTMLARCLPGVLPELSVKEALEVARVRSVLGELKGGCLDASRPFRSPHHGISTAGLVGGGARTPQPGEITRAHHGVLFLDELAEFAPSALQAMRQPLEEGSVTITRSSGSVTYPARFQLVAATNPCPCGWFGDPQHACRCTDGLLSAYRRALSGPLLDRIDLRVNVSRPRLELLTGTARGEESAAVRERVVRARDRQLERQGKLNSALTPCELRQHARLEGRARTALQRWSIQRGLTARTLHRAWRVALTVADLAQAATAQTDHVLEALGYRVQDEVA